ncbi:glycosyltransferase [Paenibacillus doosanensis]|uniref:N-acetylgalactosamine-N, N'-diacetylbacillosaminyl-diphospho-undecaprenol 4-alpha-N-acetylgalactosaminyltransferase n=1 Tax=Paenibacillus konkukensis TaxID=2020716 RepID=A0ABY4RUG5_9BACL|nr:MULTISPECIES: glycosyltransferase [Paenibacillus]MCS7461017.1 glycosyltransferase [Paenibacillus doosanensis]UQZ85688.1 N-acetylgalactosamine-N,N'-diacetylbacillosaminyl-diphospho-undecaprenol 4-alpha-N-acetylgalactosaminyltransferase [Paenibacillus konkukensis]
MKKNLLFIMPSLMSGGGEKSLVTLLNQIDFQQYNVDLFLLDHNGLFMELIPEKVELLPLTGVYHEFRLPMLKAFRKLLRQGYIALAFHRIAFTLSNRGKRNISQREQYSWRHMASFLDRLPKTYDAAIGFMEKTSIYFCVDKVNAHQKIGWVHTDYDQMGMDSRFDHHYYKQLDRIVTVSEECANVLKRRFPDQQHKVEVIYNIVSPESIISLANQSKTDVYQKNKDETIIVSVGRLHDQKGFDMAIESCRKLVDRGYRIKWNIIGEGEERGRLEHLIQEYDLCDYVRLLGLRSNPYPYIKQADIYAQTSKFEGKSIAIDEAKILNKPILVTNFSTARDQISDGVDGLIVDMNAEAIAEGIEILINDKQLRTRLIYNLSRTALGTEGEIEKFYQLLT